jgi:uncharacterized membrane protein
VAIVLVMMTPALIWTAWIMVNGQNKQMPPLLMVGPFVLCPLLYWLLIQWGRRDFSEPGTKETQATTQGGITIQRFQ